MKDVLVAFLIAELSRHYDYQVFHGGRDSETGYKRW
jgi:hypothetical protein